MKKFVLVCAAVAAVSFASCAGKKAQTQEENAQPAEQVAQTAEEVEAQAEVAEVAAVDSLQADTTVVNQ